jgi:hypothetical protein
MVRKGDGRETVLWDGRACGQFQDMGGFAWIKRKTEGRRISAASAKKSGGKCGENGREEGKGAMAVKA